MIMFALGLVFARIVEWWVHKVLFHQKGKKKGSPFAFHLREHHADCIKGDYHDDNFSSRELLGLIFLTVSHIPIYFLSPSFYVALLSYAIAFHVLHGYSHKNPQWAKKYQPWHWKHHMENPNKNWNVVLPIADWIMRTNK